MRNKIGPIFVFIIIFIPILRWLMLPGLNNRFFDINSTFTSLGQIAGLVGITMIAINLILSARFKFLDEIFFGLDKLYINHQNIGAIAFSLLLFHPLFLAVKLLHISLRDAALFFLPGQSTAVNWGIIALSLMMVLMIITFYVKLKYQQWKFSHKFMVLVFAFAILHAMFITSDISRDIILRTYILGIAVLGLTAGFYQAFLSQYLNNNYQYKIKGVNPINSSIVSIEMEPDDKAIQYQPGQFVFISFVSKNISNEVHPFSISSSPDAKSLTLTVKSLGDYTNELKKLQLGEKASIEGPYGKFNYNNFKFKEQIWIAGGIGITPFVSMARSLGPDHQIDLYYSVINKEDAVFLNELNELAKVNKNFNIIPWYTNDQGYITAKEIMEKSRGLGGKDILLCGPPIFMESLRQQLNQRGVADRFIHWEKFSFV